MITHFSKLVSYNTSRLCGFDWINFSLFHVMDGTNNTAYVDTSILGSLLSPLGGIFSLFDRLFNVSKTAFDGTCNVTRLNLLDGSLDSSSGFGSLDSGPTFGLSNLSLNGIKVETPLFHSFLVR